MHIKISHTLKIIGLAMVTFGLALAIGLLLPKSTQAPIIINQTPENQLPTGFSLDQVTNNDRVSPGQIITGSIPGVWFFEGSFPVQLQDVNGTTFTTIIATTAEDWMTTNNVSFTTTLPETFTYTGVGKLVFMRDDPSDGESGIDMADFTATIPVIFEN